MKYEVIFDLDDIVEPEIVCFDFETTTNDKEVKAYWWAKDEVEILLLALTVNFEYNYIIPIHPGYGHDPISEYTLDQIYDLMMDDSVTKCGHNLKFDLHVMRKLLKCDFDPNMRMFYDTMILGHIINADTKKSLDNWTDIYFPEYSGYGKGIKYDLTTPFEKMSSYAATDTWISCQLFDIFMTIIEEEPSFDTLLNNYHFDTLDSLYDAERHGAYIDKDILVEYWQDALDERESIVQDLLEYPEVYSYIYKRNKREVKKKILEYKEKIKKHKEGSKWHSTYLQRIKDLRSGKAVIFETVNWSSPDQMKELLYTSDGFDHRGKSTNEEALKEIDDAFSNQLLDYRAIDKLINTYYAGMFKYITKHNKIHCSYNIVGTKTGRASSSDPNLQNIPKHKVRDRVKKYTEGIRHAFIAPEGYYICQLDFSQAELRMIANISGDENMIETYLQDLDIHSQTGAKFAHMDYVDFLESGDFKYYRQVAKSANFGLVYGMQAKRYIKYLWSNTGEVISMEEADRQINAFFAAYPKLKRWHYMSINTARHRGYSQSFFGHRLPLPNIKSQDFWERVSSERLAINQPIQGTVGQLTLWAGALSKDIVHPSTQYFLTVHDSLVYYIRKSKFESEASKLKHLMENLPVEKYFGRSLGPVPMKVDVEYGDNWKDLKPIEL